MSQTSTIFFYILAGFLVYITAKGELGRYLDVLLGRKGNLPTGAMNPQGFPSLADASNSLASYAKVTDIFSGLGDVLGSGGAATAASTGAQIAPDLIAFA